MRRLLLALGLALAAPPAVAQPAPGQLTVNEFVQSSMAGLQFMVEASEMAAERAVREDVQNLAATIRDAHRAMARDLLAAMELAGKEVDPGLREMFRDGYQRAADAVALDEALAEQLRALGDLDEDFEAAYLRAMADGHESAKRWWSRYAYDSEDETVRLFADHALLTIRELAEAVARLRGA
jgi:predicted outer membrane protein